MTWASLAGSLAAVLALAAVAKLLGLGRLPKLESQAQACGIADDALTGFAAEAAVLDRDGRAALLEGADGAIALIRAHGANWVVRRLMLPLDARADGECLIVRPDETMFGDVTLLLDRDEAGRWAARLGRRVP